MITQPGFIYSFLHHDKYGRLLYASPGSKNTVTDEGLNYFNAVSLTAGTQKTAFYVLLFGDNYTILGTETYAAPGVTEFTSYDETTRPLWNPSGTANAEATNADNPAIFTMSTGTAGLVIYGAGIVSGNIKGDTLAIEYLISIQKFQVAQIVNAGGKISLICNHRMRRP